MMLGLYKRRKQAASDLSIDNCLNAARVTAKTTRYCFLITNSGSAWPGARLVQPICDLDRFEFAVGTNPALRKVREITANPHVVLAFGNTAENANLIVYGTATVSTDPDMKHRYWMGRWRLFFPDGPDGDDYAVIRIHAEKMEILSFRRNVIPEPFGLRPVVLQKTRDGWEIQASKQVPDNLPAAASPGQQRG